MLVEVKRRLALRPFLVVLELLFPAACNLLAVDLFEGRVFDGRVIFERIFVRRVIILAFDPVNYVVGPRVRAGHGLAVVD